MDEALCSRHYLYAYCIDNYCCMLRAVYCEHLLFSATGDALSRGTDRTLQTDRQKS